MILNTSFFKALTNFLLAGSFGFQVFDRHAVTFWPQADKFRNCCFSFKLVFEVKQMVGSGYRQTTRDLYRI